MKLLVCLLSATIVYSRYVPSAEFDFSFNNGEMQKAFGFVQYVLQQQDFYKNVPSEGQVAFLTLLTDATSPRNQVEASLNAWAEKYGVQTQWKDFSSKVKARQDDVNAAIKEILKQLPGIYDQIVEINADQTLSVQGALEKIGVVAQPIGGRLMGAIQPLVDLFFPNGAQETIQGMIPPFGGQRENQNGFNFNNNNNQIQTIGNGAYPQNNGNGQNSLTNENGQNQQTFGNGQNQQSFGNGQNPQVFGNGQNSQTNGNGQNPQAAIFNGQHGFQGATAAGQAPWSNNFNNIVNQNRQVPVVLN